MMAGRGWYNAKCQPACWNGGEARYYWYYYVPYYNQKQLIKWQWNIDVTVVIWATNDILTYDVRVIQEIIVVLTWRGSEKTIHCYWREILLILNGWYYMTMWYYSGCNPVKQSLQYEERQYCQATDDNIMKKPGKPSNEAEQPVIIRAILLKW